MRGRLLFVMALAAPALAGCNSAGDSAHPLAASPPPVPAAGAPVAAAAPGATVAPEMPTGAALGGVLGGPVGASLSDADRQAAWTAQVGALDSGQRRSWRGAQGVFGFVEPGAETGAGCRPYSQTIYVAGRPNRGQGTACKGPDGAWKMTS